jgi:HSP20 family molecular chaperone IbpA
MDEIGRLLASVAESLEENKPIIINRKSSHMGFDITTNLSVRFGLLKSIGADPDSHAIEPLVDVLEDDFSIKVIALVPGIKKEDIDTSIHDGFIDVTIRQRVNTIHKSIPCNVPPSQIAIKSFRYNNSVLEIIFGKGKR